MQDNEATVRGNTNMCPSDAEYGKAIVSSDVHGQELKTSPTSGRKLKRKPKICKIQFTEQKV